MELIDYLVYNKFNHTPFNKDKDYKFLYKRSEGTAITTTNYYEKDYITTAPTYKVEQIQNKESIERVYIRLLSNFQKIMNADENNFIEFSKLTVVFYFKEVLLKLVKIGAKDIRFDITEDSSIYFQSKISKYNVYLELYFDEEINESHELIVNLYKDKKVKLAFGSDIDNAFRKVEDEISQKDLRSYRIVSTNLPYEEVSEGSFATETF